MLIEVLCFATEFDASAGAAELQVYGARAT